MMYDIQNDFSSCFLDIKIFTLEIRKSISHILCFLYSITCWLKVDLYFCILFIWTCDIYHHPPLTLLYLFVCIQHWSLLPRFNFSKYCLLVKNSVVYRTGVMYSYKRRSICTYIIVYRMIIYCSFPRWNI